MRSTQELSLTAALEQLGATGKPFVELLSHGSLSVELYKPDKVDLQKPHDRDEVYVIVSGTGIFIKEGKKWSFKPGDLLFVPAYVEHRFVDFTEDFATWVIFYGPVGGERTAINAP